MIDVPPPARIVMEKGELVDAQFGSLSGLDAAVALINMKDPQTKFVVGERSNRRTIDLPFTEVLYEAAQKEEETSPGVWPSNIPSLRVTLGTEIKTYPIRPGITFIGRASLNDIVIADVSVAQRHASLEYSSKGFFLRDFGTANGTFVAGDRISEQWLGEEESIIFGAVHCLFNGPKG